MKQSHHRWQRTLILCLLSLSVVAPVVFVSRRLQLLTRDGRREFLDDLSSIKYRTDPLNAIEQEDSEELEEPKQVVYKENDVDSRLSDGSENNNDSEESRIEGSRNNFLEKNVSELDHDETQEQEAQQKGLISTDETKEQEAQQKGLVSTDETQDQDAQQKGLSSTDGDQKKFNITAMDNQKILTHSQRKTDQNIKVKAKQSGLTVNQHRQISRHQSRRVTNQTVMEIKDQIIRARAYLGFVPPSSTSHLAKELRLRIREMERAVGEATKDSDLSRSALQKMRHMEASLSKANRAFPDCAAMASKLRAMNHNAEEQVRSQQHEVTHLVHLAARTTPKGVHCLSMQLTADYFALRPEERKLPNENKINDPELYHYAVFSDNVLACGVVVNSTVSNSKEQEKIVFHIVTNSLNFPAISMWFLLNPPGKAAIHIQNIDNFEWLSKYNTFKKQTSSDPRYTSELNHLRFYLPDIFPTLNKILLFDHDVVVQQDLSTLWNINMEGKVIAGVGTCQEGETSFRRMDMFINFSDPYIAERFDVNACTWAFGMNSFDLEQWRRHNLTGVYHKYLQRGSNMPLFNTGSLPLGWLTFYNKIMVLDRRWHILGLGYDSGIDTKKIEQAAVIHYDGIRKPWMDIGIGRYKSYWSNFMKFDHPLLRRCNIQA
ncbi:putative galacturonosyltransferase [Trifolium repens]|nr:putative galacturonosyltransferase [Trifolium repens]